MCNILHLGREKLEVGIGGNKREPTEGKFQHPEKNQEPNAKLPVKEQEDAEETEKIQPILAAKKFQPCRSLPKLAV